MITHYNGKSDKENAEVLFCLHETLLERIKKLIFLNDAFKQSTNTFRFFTSTIIDKNMVYSTCGTYGINHIKYSNNRKIPVEASMQGRPKFLESYFLDITKVMTYGEIIGKYIHYDVFI
jgi:hypothetical protein